MANLAKDKKKILNAKYFMGNASFSTPFKDSSCLFFTTELTDCITYGKVHWVTLNLFVDMSWFYTF